MQNTNPLLIFISDTSREEQEIPIGLTRIGRSSSNEIQINDSNISKAHCILIRTLESVTIYDFSSRNGTFVGKEKACGQQLKDGDEIVIGDDWRLGYHEMKKSNVHKAEPVAKEIDDSPSVTTLSSNKQPIIPWIITGALLLCCLLIFEFRGSQVDLALSNELQSTKEQLQNERNERRRYESDYQSLNQKYESLQQKSGKQTKKLKLRVSEQQRTIDKKDNLLHITQEQLRLVRRQRDRLLNKINASQANEDNELAKTEEPKRTKQEKSTEETVTKTKTDKVKKQPPSKKVPRKNITKKDIDALAKRLMRVIENYAFPGISPENLKPMLPELVSADSVEAAKKMVELIKYSEELNKDLQKNIDFLQKRTQQLLKLASTQQNLSNESKEKHQRLFELSQKKLEIQQGQQQRLVSLQKAISEEFSQLTVPQMTKFLVTKLKSRDEVLTISILRAISSAKAQHAVENLINFLPIKNNNIRQQVFSTLQQITGQQFTSDKEWKEWWKQQ